MRYSKERYIRTLSFSFLFIIVIFLPCSASELHQVHLIDTGQSDCILIKQGADNYLIDTGAIGTEKLVLDYLDKNQVENIKFIILTHYHDDHYGGLMEIIKNKKVENVLIPLHENDNKYFICDELRDKGINVNFIGKGWYYSKGNINLKAILPAKVDKDIENNNSIVLYGKIDGVKYMFMGDAEKEEEKDIESLKLQPCDVLKVGHHGLNTSTSKILLKKIKPKISIISTDGKESPEEEVIERLENIGSKIYKTDRDGTIVINAKDKGIRVDTIKNR